MILNIKSERIEYKVLELVKKYGIDDYFFLDSSFPMINLLSRQGESKVALRFSEFEGLDTVMSMKGRVQWVWVDCFTRFPLDAATCLKLKDAGFKLCMVSPELQGRPEDIEAYKSAIRSESMEFDAVCSKKRYFPLWADVV